MTLLQLRRILASFGVSEDTSRGKGSHTLFYKHIDGGVQSYPVPKHGKEVQNCYVSGARKKFKLTKADGISDEDFFGQG